MSFPLRLKRVSEDALALLLCHARQVVDATAELRAACARVMAEAKREPRDHFYDLCGEIERLSPAERAELFGILKISRAERHAWDGALRAEGATVIALRDAYLLEFGSDGYDLRTFVDWCAVCSGAVCANAEGKASAGMSDFYLARAAELIARGKPGAE